MATAKPWWGERLEEEEQLLKGINYSFRRKLRYPDTFLWTPVPQIGQALAVIFQLKMQIRDDGLEAVWSESRRCFKNGSFWSTQLFYSGVQGRPQSP